MPARKKKAVTKSKGTALTNVRDTLRQAAQREKELTPSGGGNRISMRNDTFMFQGTDLGTEMTVVIAARVFQNAWYGGKKFNPDGANVPACYAVSESQDELAAFDASPKKQAEVCADCEFNEWGSAVGGGRGKACRNTQGLGLINAEELEAGEEDPELAYLSVPPTSLGELNGYCAKVIGALDLPSFGVITTISLDPDADYQHLLFEMVRELSDEEAAVVINKRSEALRVLTEEPDFSGYTEDAPKRASKKKTAKKAAKKKAAKKSRFS